MLTKKQAIYFILFIIILILATLIRWDNLFTRGLEYDEIWTITHYVNRSISEIFSNLKTPNNHPLYSLLVKYTLAVEKNPIIAYEYLFLLQEYCF
jgi:hypothetical protein